MLVRSFESGLWSCEREPNERVQRQHLRRDSAFSLVELLITIGVIGILLGILIPVLGRTRGQTLEVVSLSNTREVVKVFHSYAASNADAMPFPQWHDASPGQDPIRFGPVIWSPTGEVGPNTVRYFFGETLFPFSRVWPALVRDVAPWPEHYKTWLSPGHPHLRDTTNQRPLWDRGGSPGVSYHYSTAFMVSPRLLQPGASADPSLFQRTRLSMVAFPSAKVLAFDDDRSYLPADGSGAEKWPTGFTDGSASLRDRTKAFVFLNPFPLSLGYYHDTPGGVTGRDF